jgi:hypothetical protein
VYTEGYLRLNEFRSGLRDLHRVGAVVRPAWGNIGM